MEILMRKIKPFIFIMIFATMLFAGNTGKIAGRITDATTGEPLIGANIIVTGTSLGSATDLDGYYTILFVPPGQYTLNVNSMGYAKSVITDVVVTVDLTTTINVEMTTEVLEGEIVTVTAKKPLIETDLVSSRRSMTSEMIEEIPVDDIEDILNLTAGIVDGHARGGRDGEILFLINGVPAVDPIDNEFSAEVPTLGIAETNIITSGISVEYSNALSGVVNMVTQEGSSKLKGTFRMKTDDNSMVNFGFPGLNKETVYEGALGGPLLNLPVRWFVAGEVTNTQGRYGVAEREAGAVTTSLTWRPFPKSKFKLAVNNNYSKNNQYSYRYSRVSYENENSDNDDRLDRVVTIQAKDIFDPTTYGTDGLLYGLNMEDVISIAGLSADDIPKRNVMIEVDKDGTGGIIAGDGDFREEDLNGNSQWDIIDFNRSGATTDSSFIDMNDDGVYQWGVDVPTSTNATEVDGHAVILANRNLTDDPLASGFNDSFSMLDHLLRFKDNSSHISLSLNQQFAKNSFLMVSLSRFKTYYHYDTEESSSIPSYIDFLDEAGVEQKYINDYKDNLFTDWNNNDFLDISEDAFPDDYSKWLAWEDIPIQNTQDRDKFYTYGNGTTFSRNRWNEDEKVIWNFKTTLTSQATKHHLLRAGFEMNLYDVFDHDIDMPSGGNIYGQNIGSRNDWGRFGESYSDWGLDGVEGTNDDYEGNNTWDHLDYGEDGVLAIDGNGDGDYDDDFIDLPPDVGEGDGKVNYNELHEPFEDIYDDDTWGKKQQKLDPIWWGMFVEDKMEFKSLVVVSGIRVDYFNPKFSNYPSDINDPVIDQTTGGEVKNPTSVDGKFYWSPRIGISYPITNRDAFYFNYGQTFQIPQFQFMYRNINWDFSGAFPIVGNPDILPETTTSYELGLRHQIGQFWRLEVKGFYKDIQGLVDTKQIWIKANQYYTRHINGDYGNVKGLEIDLFRQFTKYFGGNINYTYSIAKGKSSSAMQNYSFTWASQIIPGHENYLDWDQRHTINATLKTTIPYIDVDMNTTVNYGSGLPYSPPNKSLEVKINTERLPHTFNMDLYASKSFNIPGFGGDTKASVFLWIDNLFNNKNITAVYDSEWYHLYTNYQKAYEDKDKAVFPSEDDNNGIDDDGDGYIDETFKDEYMWVMDIDGDGKVDYNKKHPSGGVYGIPGYLSQDRTVKFGISVKF